MPVYHGKRETEVKWVRYGGVESDETLDIMSFYAFVEWNSDRGSSSGDLIPYVKDKVNELKLEDFGMILPSDSYIVFWDKYRKSIDFSEYLSKARYEFTSINEFDFIKVIAKGHDFKYTYTKHKTLNNWKVYNGVEYYPFVQYKKSTKPGITPEKVLRVYGITFKDEVSLTDNEIKTLIIKEYMNYLCKGLDDATKIPLINSKLALIDVNFSNVKTICKNFRIERGVN